MTLAWFVAAVVALALIASLIKKAGKPSGQRTATVRRPARQTAKAPPPADAFVWPALECFDFPIAGESNYQDVLAHLVSEGEHRFFTAALIPETDNPYDRSAVRVDINGLTVGHLSADSARSFRRRLGNKKLTGQTTTCGAKIYGGGTSNTGEAKSFGVWLDLKPFE